MPKTIDRDEVQKLVAQGAQLVETLPLEEYRAHADYREGLGLFAGIENMRFKRMVKPGDTARFEAKVERMRRGFARVNVRTMVGDELAAEGVILAIFQPKSKAQ